MRDKALYIKNGYVESRTTDFGYTQYVNLEGLYRGAYARNKVVLRCNLAKEIVRDSYLSEESLQYADFLCTVLMGLCFPSNTPILQIAESLSKYFKIFIKLDQTFCRRLEELYHFKYLLIEPPVSMYLVIRNDFRECVNKAILSFSSRVKARCGITPMYYDGPIVYYSITDELDNPIVHDIRLKQEVLSVAKNWNGCIKAVRCNN